MNLRDLFWAKAMSGNSGGGSAGGSGGTGVPYAFTATNGPTGYTHTGDWEKIQECFDNGVPCMMNTGLLTFYLTHMNSDRTNATFLSSQYKDTVINIVYASLSEGKTSVPIFSSVSLGG